MKNSTLQEFGYNKSKYFCIPYIHDFSPSHLLTIYNSTKGSILYIVYVEKTIQILPPITDEDLLVEDCSVGTEERDGVETVVI